MNTNGIAVGIEMRARMSWRLLVDVLVVRAVCSWLYRCSQL